jgi:hypothetical protein
MKIAPYATNHTELICILCVFIRSAGTIFKCPASLQDNAGAE